MIIIYYIIAFTSFYSEMSDTKQLTIERKHQLNILISRNNYSRDENPPDITGLNLDELNWLLELAVYDGYMKNFVEKLLINRADPNTHGVLRNALQQNSPEIVELLLRYGAIPTTIDDTTCGYTLLEYAQFRANPYYKWEQFDEQICQVHHCDTRHCAAKIILTLMEASKR